MEGHVLNIDEKLYLCVCILPEKQRESVPLCKCYQSSSSQAVLQVLLLKWFNLACVGGSVVGSESWRRDCNFHEKR